VQEAGKGIPQLSSFTEGQMDHVYITVEHEDTRVSFAVVLLELSSQE
jgi:hypothetical protein